MTATNPDDALITLCDRIIAIHREQDAIAEADGWAPDNSQEYHALHLESVALMTQLRSAARPTTADGLRAVARMAWDTAPRDANDRVISGDTPGEWIRLQVIAWAAGEDVGPALPSCWFGKRINSRRGAAHR